MTPERWQQINELYHAARERGPQVVANADPEVKRKVEAMLAQDTARNGVLDRPAAELLSNTSVSAGTLLGPYRIETFIGKGGMGEVWKARDTRLNRDVAIKISARQFTDRFEREALAIAALNHSNICTIHDVGSNYLVMELVEGPTLAERIKRSPIPLDEALAIAKQIADALEAAHEKGIVHRDLKPANIKIRPDGSVKVLDFGLAKASEETEFGPDSPTALSMPGMIMGTPGYMSPEQARGEKVDKRTDIWAFGVVLYEMVIGQRLREPEWERVPAKVQRVLRLCLEKDQRIRLHDIADAKLLLDIEPASAAPSRSRFGKAGWVAAVAVPTVLLAALAFVHFREKPPDTTIARSTILLPEKTTVVDAPALSPDGSHLVFFARLEEGRSGLWVRSLDATTAQPLAGAEGGNFAFWSPDGRSIGFGTDGTLKRIDLSGSPPVTLANLSGFRGASWSPPGVIVFSPGAFGPLHRIPAAGGAETPVTALDPARKENTHRWPWFLPDGRHFLYAATVINTNDATIYVGSLDSPETRIVAHANSNAVYASGYLLFLRDNTLMAQPFDARRLTTTGEALPAARQIATNSSGRGLFAASDTGELVLEPDVQGGQRLVTLDRAGKPLAAVGEPGQLFTIFLSPEGRRATVAVYDRGAQNYDLWIYDLARNLRSRFSSDSANELEGVWSPDGRQIIFNSNRQGQYDLYRKPTSGDAGEELLYADGLNKYPTSWSPDGKFVMYHSQGDPKLKAALWVLPLRGDRTPIPFLQTPFDSTYGQFSPDGKWLAYQSNDSGRSEIYIAPFPGPGGESQVSTAGGVLPRWRGDGKELFYIAPDRRLMATQIAITGSGLVIGASRPLFRTRIDNGFYEYDVSADGQRFLAIQPDEQAVPEPLTLVQNWTAGLKK